MATVNAVGLPAGAGQLDIERRGDRSVVTRAIATSPLRLLTPRNHGHAAWVYSATYGGGLVDGDAIRLGISLGPGAVAMLSTQASTKVYRSPGGTSSELDADIASGAILAVLPDPVVCFAASAYRQTQRFRLNAGAGLVLGDWLSSGRRATGERWQFDRYASRIEVRQGGRLTLLDTLSLDGARQDLDSRMGRFNVLCVLVLVGAAVRAEASHALSIVSSLPIEQRGTLMTGGSAVGDDGCIVRIAGVSFEQVAAAAREYLRFVPSVLGDDPWARKW